MESAPLVCLPSSNQVWQMADHLADTHTDRSVYAKPVPAPKPALYACDRLPPKCLIDCPQREPYIAASSDAPRAPGRNPSRVQALSQALFHGLVAW